jgi:hypothetical protein
VLGIHIRTYILVGCNKFSDSASSLFTYIRVQTVNVFFISLNVSSLVYYRTKNEFIKVTFVFTVYSFLF